MVVGKGGDLGDGCPTKSVLIRSGCHNKIPQVGLFKQNNLIFSQFWKLGVQGQGSF